MGVMTVTFNCDKCYRLVRVFFYTDDNLVDTIHCPCGLVHRVEKPVVKTEKTS